MCVASMTLVTLPLPPPLASVAHAPSRTLPVAHYSRLAARYWRAIHTHPQRVVRGTRDDTAGPPPPAAAARNTHVLFFFTSEKVI
jgi:hypothetical protein